MTEENTISSPIPGTFYRRPSPDDEPFADVGDAVNAGDIVGLVEVMKEFNELKAERDGTIEAFLADDEDAVEAGQPIVELR